MAQARQLRFVDTARMDLVPQSGRCIRRTQSTSTVRYPLHSMQFELLNGCIIFQNCFESIERCLWRCLLLEDLIELSHRWEPINAKANDKHVATAQLICFARDGYGRVDCVVQDLEFLLGSVL